MARQRKHIDSYYKPSLKKKVVDHNRNIDYKDESKPKYEKPEYKKKYMLFFNHDKFGEVIFGSYESIIEAEKNAKKEGLSQYKIYTKDALGHFKLLKESNLLPVKKEDISHRITHETRKDKYGQNYKANCSCGLTSSWHTSKERALMGLSQNHEYEAELKKRISAISKFNAPAFKEEKKILEESLKRIPRKDD